MAFALGILGAALLGIVFGPRLEGAFVWDDVALVERNEVLLMPSGATRIVSASLWNGADASGGGGGALRFYRPLPMLSLWLQAQISGRSIVAFRVGNLLIHLACGVLLFFWLRRCRIAVGTSAAAVLLFLVHPSVTEPVMWIIGRVETLGAAFALAALTLWPRSDSKHPGLRVSSAGALVALAMLCKESYVATVLLFPALELLPPEDAPVSSFRDRAWRPLIPLAFASGVMAGRDVLGIGAAPPFAPIAHLAVAYASVVWHYGLQLVSLSNGPTTEAFVPLTRLAALGVLAGLAALSAALLVARQRGWTAARPALIGVVWFAVALVPYAAVVPLIGMYGNRYAYFPMFGLLTAAAALADAAIQRNPIRRFRPLFAVAGCVLIAFLSLRTTALARNWRTDLALYGADFAENPTDPQTLYHYGTAIDRRYGCERSLEYFERSAQADPHFWKASTNVAICLVKQGRYREALAPARRAVEAFPSNPTALYSLAVAELATGEVEAGTARLEQILRLDPSHALALRRLAELKQPPD